MFERHTALRDHDAKEKDRLRRKSANYVAHLSQAKDQGYSTLLALAVGYHMRDMAAEGNGRVFFSIPASSAKTIFPMVPLEVHPHVLSLSNQPKPQRIWSHSGRIAY
eukprot:6492726-Amphidinium_carterae.4